MKTKLFYCFFLVFLFTVKGSNGVVSSAVIVSVERPWLDYKWVVEKIDGKEVNIDTVNKLNIKIKPLSNSFSGFLGCNQMGGKVTVEANRIRFKNIVAMGESCEDAQKELLFLNTLLSITNFGIIEDRLYLSNGEGVKMILIRS